MNGPDASKSAEEILAAVSESLYKFSAGAEQSDDITMLAVKFERKQAGTTLTAHLTGDLNVKTSPQLESELTKQHVNPSVREIIRLAGFLQVIHIED